MKIQGERPDEIAAPPSVGQTRGARTDAAPPAGTTDRINVSSDARLLNHAVQAANDAPAIRMELVDRAKKLLESGQLGADVDRLADKMIDHMMRL